jgi:hypothetical protein
MDLDLTPNRRTKNGLHHHMMDRMTRRNYCEATLTPMSAVATADAIRFKIAASCQNRIARASSGAFLGAAPPWRPLHASSVLFRCLSGTNRKNSNKING